MQDMRRIGRRLSRQSDTTAARPEEGPFESSAESNWLVGNHCTSQLTLTALSATLESHSDRRGAEPSLQDVSDDGEQRQRVSFNEDAGEARSPPQKRAVGTTDRQSHDTRSSLKETSAKAPTILPEPEMSDMVEADLYVKPVR